MSKKKQKKEDLRTRLAELTGWHTATRNDAFVAHKMVETKSVDRVHSLNEACFFDEFFQYLKEIGLWPLLKDLDPQNRIGPIYPFIRFVLVIIMRCVGGIESMLATQELLLSDPAIMDIIGFNAAQVQSGSCDRGLNRLKTPKDIRGAFSYETVADNIVEIGPDKLEKMFNGAIHCLAQHGAFAKVVDIVVDGTDNEATPNYQTDNGEEVPHVTKEKRPDVRANGHAKKIKTTVYGWKIWLAFDPQSGIPIAMKMDGINVADNTHAYEVIDQACKNLKGYSTINSVALDRGFLDGKLLWKIENEIKAIVYIPAKSNMDITTEARQMAKHAEKLASQGKKQEEGITYKERIQKINHGSGTSAWIENRKTTVVRIQGLDCDWWTPAGATSAANSKKFIPKQVNATVVLRWDGAPADEEKEVVILDTDPSTSPFAGFDAYDERSKIENTANREAKETWFLEHHPKRSESGVRVLSYFIFMCMALITAFRKVREEADQAEAKNAGLGLTRYRRKLEMLNQGKVTVFFGHHFGIFTSHEMLLLIGAHVKECAIKGETVESILERYKIIDMISKSSTGIPEDPLGPDSSILTLEMAPATSLNITLSNEVNNNTDPIIEMSSPEFKPIISTPISSKKEEAKDISAGLSTMNSSVSIVNTGSLPIESLTISSNMIKIKSLNSNERVDLTNIQNPPKVGRRLTKPMGHKPAPYKPPDSS